MLNYSHGFRMIMCHLVGIGLLWIMFNSWEFFEWNPSFLPVSGLPISFQLFSFRIRSKFMLQLDFKTFHVHSVESSHRIWGSIWFGTLPPDCIHVRTSKKTSMELLKSNETPLERIKLTRRTNSENMDEDVFKEITFGPPIRTKKYKMKN